MSQELPNTEPQIIEMPAERMAVIEGRGSPPKVIGELVPVLYNAVYALEAELKKHGSAFHAGALRARYPEISNDPDNWRIIIGTPVPDDLNSLARFPGGNQLRLEDWRYGTVAEILHLGAYDQVEAAMLRLEKFVADNGYQIVGPYEEEYLSGPEEKVPKTIIRCEVTKK